MVNLPFMVLVDKKCIALFPIIRSSSAQFEHNFVKRRTSIRSSAGSSKGERVSLCDSRDECLARMQQIALTIRSPYSWTTFSSRASIARSSCSDVGKCDAISGIESARSYRVRKKRY